MEQVLNSCNIIYIVKFALQFNLFISKDTLQLVLFALKLLCLTVMVSIEYLQVAKFIQVIDIDCFFLLPKGLALRLINFQIFHQTWLE
jgi:hypothetical protein